MDNMACLLSFKGNNAKKAVREEWMTELPPELGKNFGTKFQLLILCLINIIGDVHLGQGCT